MAVFGFPFSMNASQFALGLLLALGAGQSVVVLGLTPPYLARHSQEALYEIDLGVLKSESDAVEERFRTFGGL
jgi:hypothetical protein